MELVIHSDKWGWARVWFDSMLTQWFHLAKSRINIHEVVHLNLCKLERSRALTRSLIRSRTFLHLKPCQCQCLTFIHSFIRCAVFAFTFAFVFVVLCLGFSIIRLYRAAIVLAKNWWQSTAFSWNIPRFQLQIARLLVQTHLSLDFMRFCRHLRHSKWNKYLHQMCASVRVCAQILIILPIHKRRSIQIRLVRQCSPSTA